VQANLGFCSSLSTRQFTLHAFHSATILEQLYERGSYRSLTYDLSSYSFGEHQHSTESRTLDGTWANYTGSGTFNEYLRRYYDLDKKKEGTGRVGTAWGSYTSFEPTIVDSGGCVNCLARLTATADGLNRDRLRVDRTSRLLDRAKDRPAAGVLASRSRDGRTLMADFKELFGCKSPGLCIRYRPALRGPFPSTTRA